MKALIFHGLNHIQTWMKGKLMRNVGRSIYKIGLKLQGDEASQDRLVPSLRKVSHQGYEPQIQQCDFVAPNAVIMGNVKVGYKSSIWYASTLLGNTSIQIGKNCVLQDRVHLSHDVRIGDGVFVGPNAIIQGSIINNRGFVSMGASLRHVTVQRGGFVAAGAVLQQGSTVREGEVWAGNPAKMIRQITPLQRQVLREHLNQMQDLALMHDEQTQKSAREVIDEDNEASQTGNFDDFMQDMVQYPLNFSDQDDQFPQQRVLMRERLQYPQLGKDYEPYEYDMQQFGEKFNIGVHEQEFKKVATKIKAKQTFETDKGPWHSPF